MERAFHLRPLAVEAQAALLEKVQSLDKEGQIPAQLRSDTEACAIAAQHAGSQQSLGRPQACFAAGR